MGKKCKRKKKKGDRKRKKGGKKRKQEVKGIINTKYGRVKAKRAQWD
jgi:hypothetical protein